MGHLPKQDLLAVTRVDRTLQDLAHRSLYRTIKIPYIAGDIDAIFFLNRTLDAHPELAPKIKRLDLTIMDRTMSISVSARKSADKSLAKKVTTHTSEPIQIRKLLEHVIHVEHLSLELLSDPNGIGMARLKKDCVAELFPGFNPLTAHLNPPAILQKVLEMCYRGEDFHWIMARSPCLRKLEVDGLCRILADGAPEETNPALKSFSLMYRSAILNPNVDCFDTLTPFLAHFPSLESLKIQVEDDPRTRYSSSNRDNINENSSAGTYSLLVTRLEPGSKMLTTLDLAVDPCSEPHYLEYMHYIIPRDGFRGVTALKNLYVPHNWLFGPVVNVPQWVSHHPSITDTLLTSIEFLEVYCPRI